MNNQILYLVVFLILSESYFLKSQNTDFEKINGQMYQYNKNGQTIFINENNDTSKVFFEKWRKPQYPKLNKIFSKIYLNFAIGTFFRNSDQKKYSELPNINLKLSLGYRYNKYLNIGVGMQDMIIDDYFLKPLYFEVYGTFSKKGITPIYILQMGWGQLDMFKNFNYTTTDNRTEIKESLGLHFNPSIGLLVNTKVNIYITLGYLFQNYSSTTKSKYFPYYIADADYLENESIKTININFHKAEFKIGIIF